MASGEDIETATSSFSMPEGSNTVLATSLKSQNCTSTNVNGNSLAYSSSDTNAAKPVKQKMSTDFVKKLYQMLEIQDYRDVVRWTDSGESFVVLDNNEFTKFILPNHFKHSNFASFVRQLNKYDFHKVKQTAEDKTTKNYGDSAWEFKHPDFKINNIDALDNIKRKVSSTQRKKPPTTNETTGPSEEIENINNKLKDLENANLNLKADFKTLNDRYAELLNGVSHVHQINLQYQSAFISLTQSLSASGMQIPNFSLPIIPQQQLLQLQQLQQNSPSIVKLEPSTKPFPHTILQHSSLAGSHMPSIAQPQHQQPQIINLAVNSSNANQTDAAANQKLLGSTLHNGFNTNGSSTISGHSDISNSKVTPPAVNNLRNKNNNHNNMVTTANIIRNVNSNMVGGSMPVGSADNNDNMTKKLISSSPNDLSKQVLENSAVVASDTGLPSTNNGVAASTATATSNTSDESLDQMNLPPPFTGLFHILLVEDDAVCLQLCRKFLLKYGCTVEIVTDGLSAISVLNKRKYDLVLMDIVMPNLDGASATSIIRNFDSTTPIIAMTSNIDDSDLMAYLRHGMSDILAKPFTRQDLYLILEKHLKQRVPLAQQQPQQQPQQLQLQQPEQPQQQQQQYQQHQQQHQQQEHQQNQQNQQHQQHQQQQQEPQQQQRLLRQKSLQLQTLILGKVAAPNMNDNMNTVANTSTSNNSSVGGGRLLVNDILESKLLKKPRLV